MDLTAVEGIDAVHALTLVSELGTDFTQVADGEALHELAGAVPELEEDGREGEVEPDAAGEEPGGGGAAAGGVGPDAEHELPGGVPAAAAVAAGGAEGDDGDGPQAGPDRVPPDAVRGGVREEDEAAYAEQSDRLESSRGGRRSWGTSW